MRCSSKKLVKISILLNEFAKSIAFLLPNTSILILNISLSINPSEQSYYILGNIFERIFDFDEAKSNYELCYERNKKFCNSEIFRLTMKKNEIFYYKNDANMIFTYLLTELIENQNEDLFQQLLLPYLAYHTPQQFHSYLILFFNIYKDYDSNINIYSQYYSVLPFLFPHTSNDNILIKYFEYYINNLQLFISKHENKVNDLFLIYYIRTNIFKIINISLPKYLTLFSRLYSILDSIKFLHGVSSKCKSNNNIIFNTELKIKIGFYLSTISNYDINYSFQKMIQLLPFEDFERIVIVPPGSKYIVEKYCDYEDIIFVEISNEYDLAKYRNAISDLELDIFVYQNIYSDWLTYLLTFNRLASVQIVFTNYLPIVASDYIDFIMFCERIKSVDINTNSQIINIETSNGFYILPSPIPIINKTKLGFDEYNILISFPFVYYIYILLCFINIALSL